MSFAVGTVSKPLSVATKGCLISGQSLLSSSKVSYSDSYVSIPHKPVKLHLSCKHIPKGQESRFRTFVLDVQQEENHPLISDEGEALQTILQLAEDEMVEPSEACRFYVGNLPYDVDSEKLAKLFEPAGVVELAEIIYNRKTDQSRGFGFLTMKTEEDAQKALKMFNGYELDGRTLHVNRTAPRGSRPRPQNPSSVNPSFKLFVANLQWSISKEDLADVFSKQGTVVNTYVVCDVETGRSRGCGFVVMSSESEMNDAIANLNGQMLRGRPIKVALAQSKPRRSVWI